MPRLKVQEIASAKGLNISQLQIRVGVAMGTMRRYWYGTRDGKEVGERLTEVDLDTLGKIAAVLGTRLTELIDEADWLTLHSALAGHLTEWRAESEVAGVVGAIPALHP